ncbi:MAG: ATP-dependent helicase [Phycisphaerae bacterium]
MDLLEGLNEPQREAVQHVDGPMLVLAGAGSGKTRVITRRVAYLVNQGIAPWNVLAITFTNKAAQEMAERAARLGVPRGATLCTFHSLCARLLREFPDLAGLDGNYSIYDRNDQIKLVKEAMTRQDISTRNFSPSGVHGTISNAKNELKMPEAYAEEMGSDYYGARVAKIYKVYQELLRTNNAVDFDDLLLKVAFMMRNQPDLRQALGQRYKYILIDEYQDTNRAQYIIAHGLAMDHENICATGDPDQSIYAWRGADINNILDFEDDYPNATVIRLEENYRSTKPILDAASHLIGHNQLRKDKELWTRKEGGADVNVVYVNNSDDEARYVARTIRDYVEGGGRYDDVAVFYRVNSLSRGMEESLLKMGIPYRIARGTEFYNRKEIKDVLAYLKLLVNPSDDLSCERIINTPTRGIGATSVKRMSNYAFQTGMSLLDVARNGEPAALGKAAAKKARAFAQMIDSLREHLDRPVRETMEDMLKKTTMEDYLKAQAEDDNKPLENVNELINTAQLFDENAEDGTLADYLHQISLVSDADHFDGSAGAVTLMTLHAAKGLEFPAVFMLGCEQGLLPFVRNDDFFTCAAGKPDAKMEEERRLAFVGITRAQEHLTLTSARRRMIRGKTQPQMASPFLNEMGTDGVKSIDLTSKEYAAFSSAKQANRGGFYDDFEARAVIEAVEKQQEENPFPAEYEYLQPGCRVHHSKFGHGTLVSLSQPWPKTRAKVKFDRHGLKTLVLEIARLEMV